MGLDTDAGRPYALRQASATVEPGAEPEFDLRRTVMLLWRAKWLIALFAVLGVTAAYALLLRIAPLYTAETRVLWEVDQSNVANIDPVARGLSSDFFLLASQIEVLESGRLLERVVTELDLVDDPIFNANLRPPEGWTRWLSAGAVLGEARRRLFGPDEPAAAPTPEEVKSQVVWALANALSAEWLDGTYVLIIRMTTPDAERSAELANQMARFYILDQLQTKFEATRQATEWLSDRVAELRTELETAEQAVEDYLSSTTLVSEEALAVSTRQLKDLRQRAADLGEQRAEAAERLGRIGELRAAEDFAGAAELSGEPRLVALGRDIGRPGGNVPAGERDELVARFDAELDRASARLAASVERLGSQRSSVLASIVELEANLERQAKSLVELRQLQREAEASRLIYEFFLARLKETAVQEGIHRPDARVLTEAEAPGAPSSPNRSFMLAAGGGGGILFALTLVFLFERLNSSFRSTEELERHTGIAAIGTIPMAPVTRRRAVLRYLIDKPTSSFAEAIRNLRTSILLANVDNPPQVIMLTSALPQEGKSTCCIALAQISRALGKRVLLIECDIRRRTFRNYFDLPESGGVLSVVSGARAFDEVVQHDEASGLDILPGEESSVNAADIFASHRFADFIAEMRRRYDFVFIDTPPVLAVPDARVIGKIADAVVFCVRWNKTARETVSEGLRFFAQINIRIAGLVLSQVNVSKMARYGYGNYGYYKEAAKYYHD